MSKYQKYSVEQFSTDSYFIKWVVSPNEVSDKFWNEFINQFPYQKDKINEAIYLVAALKAIEPSVSQERLNLVWNRISSSQHKKRQLYPLLRWAAIIIIILSISVILPRFLKSPDFDFVETDITQIEEAKVILSDGSVKSIIKDESEIEVISNDEIIVNNDTIQNTSNSKTKENLIKVVMPYGKQSSLQLPDGTNVFINAGSQLSFPSNFDGKYREVYLVGEAFFEVNENEELPFIVHTPDINITVTGTQFNVSAYPDDGFIRTVLVSGAVSITKQALFGKTLDIKPGEAAFLIKEEGTININEVDTELYTSWIHGYVISRNDPIWQVVRKLERYYNCEIEFEQDIGQITFSGKLDLKEDVVKVVELFAYASSLKVEINNDKIKIKK